MLSVMEAKQPFTDEEWQATPESVKQYIRAQDETIALLVSKIVVLEKRIETLENKSNKNSQNSSKPPSSDGPFHRPEKKNKKSHRKRGAQKGHKGYSRTIMEPTEEKQILPAPCKCGCSAVVPGSLKPYYTHQVIELPEIRMDVLHLILNKGACRDCGKVVKAEIPKEHLAGYGPRLSALIAEISGIQGNSREAVRSFCESVLNVSISTGAIQKVVDRVSKALKPCYDAIGNKARGSDVNHVDETSWFKKGALQWLWVMANASVAYFMIHKNRSRQAFLDLIQDWQGILVSDNYGTYKKWVHLRQTCLAHLIRKAKGISELKDKASQNFGKSVVQELQLLCHWAKAPPDEDAWRQFYHRFIDLIFDHRNEENEAGALARSLIKQIDSLWIFLEVHDVDPTNNHAERMLRYGVLWRKRSKGTQSEKGNRWVERILSFKQTCRMRSIASFPLLVAAMDSFFKEQDPDLSWI
jgi:transposase